MMRSARYSGLSCVVVIVAACGGGGHDSPPPAVDAGPEPDACVGTGCDAEVDCSAVHWAAPDGCTATDLAGKLSCIPGMLVEQQPDDPNLPAYHRFDLTLAQPIDHDHPEAGTFTQRAVLFHTSDTAPVVFFTNGYGLAKNPVPIELTRLASANQISYEHRFFVDSRPSPLDWTKLDIRQAELDAHHLAQAMHWIYPGRWVNTGGSKGGITSVIHRRFHPCDVDATVAYVAPISAGVADQAYNGFIDHVGGDGRAACRAAITAFQRRLLEQRETIEQSVQGTFTLIDLDRAYEIVVVELSFVFWQYGNPDDATHGCNAIPDENASPGAMLGFLQFFGTVDQTAGAGSLDYYHAYYHQSAAQLGYPAIYTAGIADLLRYPGVDTPNTYLPANEQLSYDPQPMADVGTWVTNHGSQMLFLYGELDPWSAEMFQPSSKDSHRFIAPGNNHESNIAGLSATDRATVADLLSRWLSVQVPVARAAPAAVGARPPSDELGGSRPPL